MKLILLGLRLMIEWQILCDVYHPENALPPLNENYTSLMWQQNTPEEHQFWTYQISFWHNMVQLDNIRMWDDEDLEYLNKNYAIVEDDFDFDLSHYVKGLYLDVKSTLESGHAHSELLGKFFSDPEGWKGLRRWMSIVTTRNHMFNYNTYYWLREEDMKKNNLDYFMYPNITEREKRFFEFIDLNDAILTNGTVSVVLPFMDLTNHYHPKNYDDATHFYLNVRFRQDNTDIYGKEKDFPPETDKQGYIAIATSQPSYKAMDEILYTYNLHSVTPQMLMTIYGFTWDNNPFSNAPLYVRKFYEELNLNQAEALHTLCSDYAKEIVPHVPEKYLENQGCQVSKISPKNMRMWF